jgi:hypothetical protein
MKKIFILVCSVISLPIHSFFGLNQKKETVCTDVNVVFKSKQTQPNVINVDYHKNAEFAIELLTNLAEQQEHRKLTMEELTLVIRVISFLFLQETDDYSKMLEVHLKNGKKIYVPYSAELFTSLIAQNDSNSESEEK